MAQTELAIEPLDEDEALTLAITKLWSMEDERRNEEDLGRQYVKRLVCDDHIARVRRTPGVAEAGEASPDAWHDLLQDPDKVAHRWNGFASRERAMLFLLELVAFSPWGPQSSSKYLSDRATRGRRLDRLRRVASNAGSLLEADDANVLDSALAKAMRQCGHDRAKTALLAVAAVSGAAAGALTGGLAAPAIGGLVGSSIMGYSGAVATNAGLALLGGGSLASGGAGMAGGTALVTGVVGAAGLGAGAAGGSAVGSSYLSVVNDNEFLVDAAKLTVVARYVLDGATGPDRQTQLRAGMQQRRDELDDEVKALGGQGGLLRRPQSTRKLITIENALRQLPNH